MKGGRNKPEQRTMYQRTKVIKEGREREEEETSGGGGRRQRGRERTVVRR